jgi:hypothetical protein
MTQARLVEEGVPLKAVMAEWRVVLRPPAVCKRMGLG